MHRTRNRSSLAELRAKLEACETGRTGAYEERSRVLALACRFAVRAGFRAGIGCDTSEADPYWQNVIYIDLPTGQVSWHISKDDLRYFKFLKVYRTAWDGHTTEEKYRRVARFAK